MTTLNELTPEEKAQYDDVADELRCLVCQNQSIGDSQASLATDLKQIIVDQIRQGQTKTEIKQFMQDRYGEFILYKPAYSVGNSFLWLSPFVLLLIAFILARKVINSHQRKQQENAESLKSSWAESIHLDDSHQKN